jgi:hypothetical protein
MQNVNVIRVIVSITVFLVLGAFQNAPAQTAVTPAEARAIAKEAYIYANPLVDSYRAMYSWFVDEQDPEFKAPLNQIGNVQEPSRISWTFPSIEPVK